MPVKITFGKKHQTSRTASLFGGVICFLISGTAFYFLFSDDELHGAIPFIPEVLNTAFGILFIGAGAVLTGILGMYAFYEFFRGK